jgi:GT2 family glycosyltransferase
VAGQVCNVSVIVVNWNAKRLLLECIRSILERNDGFLRDLIVVDNGSVDGSGEAVQSVSPLVRVIENKENLGFARANNLGVAHSSGEYLFFVNSDVVVSAGCIKELATYLEVNPSVAIVGPRLLNPDGSLQPSCKRRPTLWRSLCLSIGLHGMFPRNKYLCGEDMHYFAHDETIEAETLVGAFLGVRKAALDDVGLFDERFFFYGEEVDLCMRAKAAGWRVVFHPNAEATHLGGGSSSSDPERFLLQMHKSRYLFWRKHASSLVQLLYTLIAILRNTRLIVLSLGAVLLGPAAIWCKAQTVRTRYHVLLSGIVNLVKA